MSQQSWDRRFLDLAKMIAGWSKDSSTKVGAVITKGKRIVSVGFNGFAAGVYDSPDRYADREFKLMGILHAEDNAILFAKQDLSGCTIYTWPAPPCARCAAKIIQVGITRVVSVEPSLLMADRWRCNFEAAQTMFDEAGVYTDIIKSI